MSDKDTTEKTKYIEPRGLGKINPIEAFREKGPADKFLDFMATKVGKPGDKEGDAFVNVWGGIMKSPEKLLRLGIKGIGLAAYPLYAFELAKSAVDRSISEGKARESDRVKLIEEEAKRLKDRMESEQSYQEFLGNSDDFDTLLPAQKRGIL